MRVTERPRSLDPSKAIAMAICPITVHFSTWRMRSLHDVACEFARAGVRSKDAQKQLARTSLNHTKIEKCLFNKLTSVFYASVLLSIMNFVITLSK